MSKKRNFNKLDCILNKKTPFRTVSIKDILDLSDIILEYKAHKVNRSYFEKVKKVVLFISRYYKYYPNTLKEIKLSVFTQNIQITLGAIYDILDANNNFIVKKYIKHATKHNWTVYNMRVLLKIYLDNNFENIITQIQRNRRMIMNQNNGFTVNSKGYIQLSSKKNRQLTIDQKKDNNPDTNFSCQKITLNYTVEYFIPKNLYDINDEKEN